MTMPEWFLLVFFLAAGGVGLVLAASMFYQRAHKVSDARLILEERFARGELSAIALEERRSHLSPPGDNRRWWPLAVALLVVGFAGTVVVVAFAPDWSMGSMMNGGMGDMGSMMAAGHTERNAPAPKSGAEVMDVSAREYSFSPSSLDLHAGATVNIEFTNDGTSFHTFTLLGRDFSLEALPGDTVQGALRITEPGTYKFICKVPGHEQSGMHGEITVTR